jgi:hypothetical protein
MIPIVILGFYIPLTLYWIPVWLLYAVVSGTAAFGIWILGKKIK